MILTVISTCFIIGAIIGFMISCWQPMYNNSKLQNKKDSNVIILGYKDVTLPNHQ